MASGREKVLNQVTFKVFRFDPEISPRPRFDSFTVPVREGMTVLDGLFYILENLDPSLAFRFSCRGAVCGSCAMLINGAYNLACQSQIAWLGKEVTVSPLPHMPLIKDLVVDMTGFYEKIERVMPYLVARTPPPEKEYIQSIEQRHQIDEVVDCIWCGSCYSACPVTWTNREYLGPAALTKAYRFIADSRDEARAERLDLVSGEDGVWRCHNIFNCVEACPKKINQNKAIGKLRRWTLARRLKWR